MPHGKHLRSRHLTISRRLRGHAQKVDVVEEDPSQATVKGGLDVGAVLVFGTTADFHLEVEVELAVETGRGCGVDEGAVDVELEVRYK
jgi:hypothetical protein